MPGKMHVFFVNCDDDKACEDTPVLLTSSVANSYLLFTSPPSHLRHNAPRGLHSPQCRSRPSFYPTRSEPRHRLNGGHKGRRGRAPQPLEASTKDPGAPGRG
ncbi:hypothetical protein ACOMHN_005331 [Nucella lapillus]